MKVKHTTPLHNSQPIENNILAHTQGYVKKYDILSEGRSGDWYKVRIRALVATRQLHEDLDSLGLLRSPSVGNPRVALLIQEWINEKPDTTGNATRALTQGLLDKGFRVVDLPTTVNSQDDPIEIAKTLSRGAAELLIAGLARAESMGHGKDFGGLHSFRATVNFRVLEVGTGEVLQTVSQVASGLEATPQIAAGKALATAAQLAAGELSSLPEELQKRSHVMVTIAGITSFEALGNFQKSLASQAGVHDSYLRSFNQSTATAVLDVYIDQLSPQELADACVRIGGSTWSIYQVVGRSVSLSASPAGR